MGESGRGGDTAGGCRHRFWIEGDSLQVRVGLGGRRLEGIGCRDWQVGSRNKAALAEEEEGGGGGGGERKAKRKNLKRPGELGGPRGLVAREGARETMPWKPENLKAGEKHQSRNITAGWNVLPEGRAGLVGRSRKHRQHHRISLKGHVLSCFWLSLV